MRVADRGCWLPRCRFYVNSQRPLIEACGVVAYNADMEAAMSRPGVLEITVLTALLAVTGSCGKASPPTPSSPTPGVLQVGGSYRIDQRAVTDTCGQTGSPASVNATVTHAAGAQTFAMADTGGTNFTGTVEPNGNFTANAVFGPDSAGQTYTQRLVGRFTASGFTGDLTVDVTPRACNFTRAWTAAKQGSPNVIP
jgi:hypothetical protein